MTDIVLSSIIQGGFTLAGIIIGVLASSKLTNYRIEQLEKKVDKMQSFNERLAKLETMFSYFQTLIGGRND